MPEEMKEKDGSIPVATPAIDDAPLRLGENSLPPHIEKGAYAPIPNLGPTVSFDREMYSIWMRYNSAKFESINLRSNQVFVTYLNAYKTVVWMYRLTFAVGVVSFLASLIFAIYSGEATFSLFFGSISIITFVTVFFFRPPEALEQGLEFPSWLEIVQTYSVLRTMYLNDPVTIASDLDEIAKSTIDQMIRIIDKRQEILSKRSTQKRRTTVGQNDS